MIRYIFYAIIVLKLIDVSLTNREQTKWLGRLSARDRELSAQIEELKERDRPTRPSPIKNRRATPGFKYAGT